jgi:hypothetical protein
LENGGAIFPDTMEEWGRLTDDQFNQILARQLNSDKKTKTDSHLKLLMQLRRKLFKTHRDAGIQQMQNNVNYASLKLEFDNMKAEYDKLVVASNQRTSRAQAQLLRVCNDTLVKIEAAVKK